MVAQARQGTRSAGEVRIGISGWRYEPWRGVFYPVGLPQRQELAFASRRVSSIEINGSFYSLQRPESWLSWRDQVPEDFVFAVKGPRYITHMLRLKESRTALANFFASGVLALGDKLGPLLWQFPPQQRFDEARFDAFLQTLPRDTGQALALAREHDARLQGRDWLQSPVERTLRHAIEIRHESFVDPAFVALLRRRGVALVVADTAGRWPLLEDLCADFMYLRLHGDQELYASGYGDDALARWADRIEAWRHGAQVADAHRVHPTDGPKRSRRDVFCYFDNDVKVHAPHDAARLARRLGLADGSGDDAPFAPPPGLPGPRERGPRFSRGARRP